jgi:transcription antitermination protein NusB
MSSRRIARELAVIVFPQLPKDRQKLEKTELNSIVAKAAAMLTDYAKQCLLDAEGLATHVEQGVVETEIEHPDNSESLEELAPVPVTTAQVREILELVQRAVSLVSEALDIPEIANQISGTHKFSCTKCGHINQVVVKDNTSSEVMSFLQTLIVTYIEHREEIDNFIRDARSKWKVERMVSIDRDILRLACAEAFFMPEVPIKVAISEAVELSHRFADAKAAKFINGVLADLGEEAEKYRATVRSGLQEAADKVGKWTIK